MTVTYKGQGIGPRERRARAPWPALALLTALAFDQAYALDDSLLRIAQTGRIVLGARDTELPVSYLDASGAHIGYQMDICYRVVAAIRERYELPALHVVTVPTTVATRFALLDNNTVDMDCGHNPINSSTLQHTLVSHATLLSDVRVMTTVQQKALRIGELGGKAVGVISGSTAVGALRVIARDSKFTIKEIYGRYPDDTFRLLSTGRVDAVALPLPFLLAQQALDRDPARFVLLEGVLRTEPSALLFRLNDEALKTLANETLAGMMNSGELATLYNKWFLAPVPGLPEPLGLPASPRLQRLLAAPGSEVPEL